MGRSTDDWHPLQGFIDHLGEASARERRETGMTLGTLITALTALPPDRIVNGVGRGMSYRGYYCDFAFGPSETPRTVASLLEECRSAMGREFTGYKGGEFLMGEHTAVWISEYGGCSGLRLIGLSDTDPIVAIVHDEHADPTDR